MNRDVYKPTFFRLNVVDDKLQYEWLLRSNPSIKVHDEIEGQLKELIKVTNPSIKIKPEDYPNLINKHVGDQSLLEYGVWVYYPWNNNIVHLLDEEEFIEVRTNRNKYKITQAEQEILRTKKIGIVGLSVGQSIALTLAMERACGELRLADFDDAELSNLNRIRTGLHNLGVKKTIIAAREIAELDPFLNVITYNDGLHENNFDDFFTSNGKLDLLVEVCDGLDIKIESRFKARELGIPVVMDTNDRGMLDVERFDLEPERPVLHGLLGQLDSKSIKSLTNEEKIPIILKIANLDNVSLRGKASMIEVGQSISTWPQLASSVVLGGAVVTDIARRIFLNQYNSSGRYYIDFEDLVNDPLNIISPHVNQHKQLSYFTDSTAELLISKVQKKNQNIEKVCLSEKQLSEIVQAGIAAPSTGNDQPWKWYYTDDILYVFHIEERSKSFGNYKNVASYLTFGAVYENVLLKSQSLSLEVISHIFPLGYNEPLIFSFCFTNQVNSNYDTRKFHYLSNFILSRSTNRNKPKKLSIEPPLLKDLKEITESIDGASVSFVTNKEKIDKIADVIGTCDKIRLFNKEGHSDFINREMRWDKKQVNITKDGIDLETLGLNPSQVSALEIIKDYNTIDFVKKIEGGNILKNASVKSLEDTPVVGLISIKNSLPIDYINGGRAYERLWLASESYNLALYPMISPIYLFLRLQDEEDSGLSKDEIKLLKNSKETFDDIFPLNKELSNIFLFRLSYADKPLVRSLRIPIHQVLKRI
ncbi:MAG: Rv1355c family protein [Rickettsiales bacterium]|nr:MAG: Rv1355c family protein [Rickettsiales bacterium]